MFNICPNCGIYRVDKEVVVIDQQPKAICPVCAYAHPFKQLPLFFLSGASGSGKSTIALRLVNSLPECVVLDSDILWHEAFNDPANNYFSFTEIWLRMGKNISQNDRPVILCGSFIPNHLVDSIEKRYFSSFHFAGLVCDDAVLTERLKARPAWRGSGREDFIQAQLAFNQWFKSNHQRTNPPITLFSTTTSTVSETEVAVLDWARQLLPSPQINLSSLD